jgi:hypothetical protein
VDHAAPAEVGDDAGKPRSDRPGGRPDQQHASAVVRSIAMDSGALRIQPVSYKRTTRRLRAGYVRLQAYPLRGPTGLPSMSATRSASRTRQPPFEN